MYIEESPSEVHKEDFEPPTMIKRYSVIGNDPAFKQYTKNY